MNEILTGYTGHLMMKSNTPSRYRLMKKKDGTLVLQGEYQWREGRDVGVEWIDIPTEEEI